ncbi:MAG: porin, partial [Paracoccaceae bacterium]
IPISDSPELGTFDTTREIEMKKVLYASTALMLTAGVAAADVTISGSGRMGLTYNDAAANNNTQVDYRLRFNVDASKETDAGVKFGGRIRFQNTANSGGQASFSAAYVYAEANGFRVEVGNSNTAYDSSALMYNSEVGYIGSGGGDPQGSYFSFSSGGYTATPNRVGVYVSYSVGDFNVQASAVDADQTSSVLPVAGPETEFGMSASYKTGGFTVSAAFVTNGSGISGNDNYFVAGEFAVNDTTNVGLQYFDNGDTNGVAVGDNGQQVTIYGNTKLASGITLKGFIANNDALGNVDETVYGVGADYDLGGATLAGSIRTEYNGSTSADLGVSFSF